MVIFIYVDYIMLGSKSKKEELTLLFHVLGFDNTTP